MSDRHPHIDDVTGVETTGHVWDGDIRELNKPLPKWWLYTFYACIVWAFGYAIAYPAIPMFNDYSKGVLGFSQRGSVASEIKAARQSQEGFRAKIETMSLADVRADPDLLRFATASGSAAFQTNCAPCHGRGAQGSPGYPNLNDDDWLWGGKIEDIERTLLYGIRSDHTEARSSQMPRFGADQILSRADIEAVREYVLSMAKLPSDEPKARKGAAVFAEQCAACHGEDGKGNPELGSPNLTDAIWLYGSTPAAIQQSIETGRGGQMPAWVDRLDKTTIKTIAIYVHGLGGGR
jgi:cytochrome c oxidase cbb3-type subunit III